MRTGIMEQLPSTLATDKKVLVVGHSGLPKLSGLKSYINNLNKDGEWIQTEFREAVSQSLVTTKFGVVLTMYGVGGGALSNVRKASSNLGICCPIHALTIGDVKQILDTLHQSRTVEVPVKKTNGHKATETMIPTTSKPVVLEMKVSEVVEVPVQKVTIASSVPEKVEVLTQPVPVLDEVEQALHVLTSFNKQIDDAQFAILVVAEQLNSVKAERDKLQSDLDAKTLEVKKLEDELGEKGGLSKENDTLKAENLRLGSEVARLQGTLDNLQSLISGVRNA